MEDTIRVNLNLNEARALIGSSRQFSGFGSDSIRTISKVSEVEIILII